LPRASASISSDRGLPPVDGVLRRTAGHRLWLDRFDAQACGSLLRLGLLDGWQGLAVALIDANYVRQKYLHHLVLERRAAETGAQR
jgi:hypothetical protein